MKIDPIDSRILNEIQRDAMLSLDVISERVGLSRNACWRRIKVFEEDGLITGRVALLDPEKLGLGLRVYIQIRTSDHSQAWATKFSQVTRALPQIQTVQRMTGDLDYLICALVTDMKGYDALYQQLTKSLEIADLSASFVMEEIKSTTAITIL